MLNDFKFTLPLMVPLVEIITAEISNLKGLMKGTFCLGLSNNIKSSPILSALLRFTSERQLKNEIV